MFGRLVDNWWLMVVFLTIWLQVTTYNHFENVCDDRKIFRYLDIDKMYQV